MFGLACCLTGGGGEDGKPLECTEVQGSNCFEVGTNDGRPLGNGNPTILDSVAEKYDWINCEFINGHLIEAHFRRNPDFRWGNSEAIPVYRDNFNDCPAGYTYIEDPDFHRIGFYIK